MSNEEKILELLVTMQGDIHQMHGDIHQMQDDISGLKTGYAQMQGDIRQMQDDISGLKTGYAQMQGDISRLKANQDKMEDDILRIKGYLELDVEKRFDAINEGIDTILETMVTVERVEEIEDDVVLLKTTVKMLSQDVAELKKAQ